MTGKDADERGFFAEAPVPMAAKAQAVEAPHYLGHRQRLRDRAAAQGHDTLADYELL
jgi:DNA repair protein RadC